MEFYLLKSTALLAIFFVGYKLFLERENMHLFKRFYLLGSVLASFIIPFITFTQYVDIAPIVYANNDFLLNGSIPAEIPTIAESINYLPYVLWSIYGLGVLFFGIRFTQNLFNFYRCIIKHESVKQNGLCYVLLNHQVIPHTFLYYIFLHKDAFQKGQIPNEVLVHEEAHAMQKHTLDLLLMELLQIMLWFNPLVYFIKRSIKLNHEFLADRAVLKSGTQLSSYQKILLDFSSTSSVPAMAHSLNYSSLKKRFTVMKTHTSKRAVWLKSLIILPLLAVLVYGFSTTQEIARTASDNSEVQKEYEDWHKSMLKSDTEDIFITVREDQSFIVNEIPATLETLPQVLKQFNTHLTETERKESVVVSLNATEEIPMGFVFDLRQVLNEYGIKRMAIPNGVLLQEGITDENGVVHFSDGANSKQLETYNRLAEKYNALPISTRKIGWEDLKTLENIYRLMTVEQKENALPFPECSIKTNTATENGVINTYEQPSSIDPSEMQNTTARNIDIKILNKDLYEVNGVNATKKTLATVVGMFHRDIKPAIRSKIMNIHITYPKSVSSHEMNFIYNELLDYGFYRLVSGNQEVVLGKGNKPMAIVKEPLVIMLSMGSIVINGEKSSIKSFAKEIDKTTKNWTAINFKEAQPSVLVASTPNAFMEKLHAEFRKTTYFKTTQGVNIIPISTPPPSQKKATPAQITEYNTLAKKYNGMSKNNMVIKGKELTRMRYLYDIMTIAQRKKAERYPNIPPPPPPLAPKAEKAPKPPKVKKGLKSDIPPPPKAPKPPK